MDLELAGELMRADSYPATEHSRVRRVPKNAAYEKEVVAAILDEGLVAHVGIEVAGRPFVLPMVYARDGDRLLLHGSTRSRLLRALADGARACITVTLLDGLVIARSLFHHSMNYRSVCVQGRGCEVTGEEERLRCLRRLTDHTVPGRWDDARSPSDRELSVTTVVAVPIDEASAKVRTGPPNDEDEDHVLPHWAGVLPFSRVAGKPEPDPRLVEGIEAPPYLRRYRRGTP